MAEDETNSADAKVKGDAKPQPALNGDKMNNTKNVATDDDVGKTSVSVYEILKSTTMDTVAKFDVFRGLVEGGRLTNKEVVNAILFLVRSVIIIYY